MGPETELSKIYSSITFIIFSKRAARAIISGQKCVEYYNLWESVWDKWRDISSTQLDERVRLVFRGWWACKERVEGLTVCMQTGAGAVYTPIEAIKFSSFRLRVSKWRAPLPGVWCGSCRWGTFRRTWGLAVSIRPEGLSLLPGLPALSVGLRLRFSGSNKSPKFRGQRQSSRRLQKEKI